MLTRTQFPVTCYHSHSPFPLQPLQQLQALHLLCTFATRTSNRPQSVYAYCQLSRTLCHLGQTKLAGSLLWKAEEVMGLMEEGAGGGSRAEGDDAGGGTWKNLQVLCMLTKAGYLLYDGQVRYIHFEGV